MLRKADIVTNVLGVCAPDMQFIYVLPGWEGSAHDGRVLRDAISRPNGLRVPQGEFYFINFHLVYCYRVLSVNINLHLRFRLLLSR